ncbi:MAG: transcription termination factor NusA [Patescibacteria group bacterium]|nr:transcription termination factor NusA [Patescibacteria group bacterium]
MDKDQRSAIAAAMKQICEEKNISYDSVLETVESALGAAYRKDYGNRMQNIKVKFDVETGGMKVCDVKTVVEDLPPEELAALEAAASGAAPLPPPPPAAPTDGTAAPAAGTTDPEKPRFNPKTEIQISDAKKIKPDVNIGEELVQELETPGAFGRMAAQTAKQVITQKIREAEREMVFNEFKGREGQIATGTVQRREGRMVLIEFGRAAAILPPEEQIEREPYPPGERLKVYVVSVTKGTRGPEIVVSRSHPQIVRVLFHTEIPEIANGTVQIKGIAREAGSRTKVAVWTDDENIDPIGSCIGQRGARVQTIISELRGEKIDIIQYDANPVVYLGNALSPAKVSSIQIDEPNRTAVVTVPEDQLSLAIGRGGQNVRLAAKLTGWKIDIIAAGKLAEGAELTPEASAAPDETKTETSEPPATTPAPAEGEAAAPQPAAEISEKPKKSKKK